jgi:hypothetical protein
MARNVARSAEKMAARSAIGLVYVSGMVSRDLERDVLLQEMWYQSYTGYNEKCGKCDSIEHAKNDDESKDCG